MPAQVPLGIQGVPGEHSPHRINPAQQFRHHAQLRFLNYACAYSHYHYQNQRYMESRSIVILLLYPPGLVAAAG